MAVPMGNVVWPERQGEPTRYEGSPTSLYLYACVSKADKPHIEQAGRLTAWTPRWKGDGGVPERGYIGLRQTPEDALRRASLFEDGDKKDTHLLLQVEFTDLGLEHFAAKTQTLFKIPFRHTTEWGTWQFKGDLPLREVDDMDNLLICCRFMEIV